MYIHLLHSYVVLFFIKMTKIPDFVKYQILSKIATFHEMCVHHLVKSGWRTPTKREVQTRVH